jgi:peptidoglycan hydrolase CwlO-like protein
MRCLQDLLQRQEVATPRRAIVLRCSRLLLLMKTFLRQKWLPRVLSAAGAVTLGTLALTASSSGDLSSQIAAKQSAAKALRSAIAAQSAQISSTTHGLQDAEARLSALQTELTSREHALVRVQTQLLAARNRLVNLENRLRIASSALSTNLVARYEGGTPDLVSVILSSGGFNDLLNKIDDLNKIGHQDAQIVGATRTARAAVSREATALGALEVRDRALTESVLKQRNQVAAIQAALLTERIRELNARAGKAAQLHDLTGALNTLEKKAAEQAQEAAATGDAHVGGIAVDTGGMVQPPAGAPEAVAQVIAAGNAIATLPYIWGGGHASFQASGYDCSGSVSYALAAAGLLSAPLTSGGFESWGEPGPGKWITVYANAGHAWMDVAGWRFDTVALAEDGTRWAQGGGEFAGMVERHPPGL